MVFFENYDIRSSDLDVLNEVKRGLAKIFLDCSFFYESCSY